MTATLEFDVVVIGAGPAGTAAAIRAADLGAKTALVTRGAFGGMSANEGPIPVRTLAHAARLAREARQLPRYGIGRTVRRSITHDSLHARAKSSMKRDGTPRCSNKFKTPTSRCTSTPERRDLWIRTRSEVSRPDVPRRANRHLHRRHQPASSSRRGADGYSRRCLLFDCSSKIDHRHRSGSDRRAGRVDLQRVRFVGYVCQSGPRIIAPRTPTFQRPSPRPFAKTAWRSSRVRENRAGRSGARGIRVTLAGATSPSKPNLSFARSAGSPTPTAST